MQFIILMCCVVSIIISVLCLTVSMKNKNTDISILTELGKIIFKKN